MEKFIVAEISKSWDGDFDEFTPRSEFISRQFEKAINVNYKKGYKLVEWSFSNTFDSENKVLYENIIAEFELDEKRAVLVQKEEKESDILALHFTKHILKMPNHELESKPLKEHYLIFKKNYIEIK